MKKKNNKSKAVLDQKSDFKFLKLLQEGKSSGELLLQKAGGAQECCCLSPKGFPEEILSLPAPLLSQPGSAASFLGSEGFPLHSPSAQTFPLPGELRRAPRSGS